MVENSFVPKAIIEKNEKKSVLVEQFFYGSPTISKTLKIELEQRRRNQLYKTFDYILSVVTYFDFFTLDTFNILKISKNISKFYHQEFINTDMLFLSFIYSNTQISKLLEEYGINKENFDSFLPQFSKNSEKDKSSFFNNIKISIEKENQKENIKFSHEINLLFEKAAENALIRFKTPVITSEILFITFLELKNNKTIKLLKKIIGNDLNWQMLRYKIVKRIHKEESSIRDEISKNEYYFAYLLKTQLHDLEFDRLLFNEFLDKGVSLFRNTLVTKLLEINVNNLLLEDIHKSIEITNKRSYSK